MSHRVICISSQHGTGTEQAAQLVATRLGYRLIDEEIVARAAVEAGVDREVMSDVERRKSALVRVLEGMGSGGVGAGYVTAPTQLTGEGQPPSDELRGLIRSVIEETAVGGEVVIVAHAASLALAERADVLRVMITASPRTRARRLAAARDLDENGAERELKRSDASRADYLKRFYNVSTELPTHYDVVINTDKLEPGLAARLIVQAATGQAAEDPSP